VIPYELPYEIGIYKKHGCRREAARGPAENFAKLMKVLLVMRNDTTECYLLLIGWIYLHSFVSTQPALEKAIVGWCVTVVQGHSRSSKSVPIESPYAIFYFFIATNAYLLSFPRYNDLLVEICVFRCFIYRSLVRRPCKGCSLVTYGTKFGLETYRAPALADCENCTILRLLVLRQ